MITALELLNLVFDAGTWRSWDAPALDPPGIDPAYAEALAAARGRTGLSEAVLTGEGEIGGRRVAAMASEFGFLGGSIGAVAAERLHAAVRRATAERLPLLGSPASGGVRLQEGTAGFARLAGVAAALGWYRAAGLPYLVYLRHPTTGGVLASWGSLGQFTAAEPGATIGYHGPRVVSALTGVELPAGVQTAENLARHGLVDLVAPPAALGGLATRVLDLLAARDAVVLPGGGAPVGTDTGGGGGIGTAGGAAATLAGVVPGLAGSTPAPGPAPGAAGHGEPPAVTGGAGDTAEPRNSPGVSEVSTLPAAREAAARANLPPAATRPDGPAGPEEAGLPGGTAVPDGVATSGGAAQPDGAGAAGGVGGAEFSAAQVVASSRRADRPGVVALLTAAATGVTRLADPAPGLVLALARFGSVPCVLLGHDRRGPVVYGLAAAGRGYRLAAELRLPLVTVVDSGGAELSVRAEEGGLSAQVAVAAADLAALPVPTLCLLLGQGAGGPALAWLPADRVLAAEHAWLAPLPPEGAAAILRAEPAELSATHRIRAADLLAAGIVHRVVPESPDATAEPLPFLRRVGAAIAAELAALASQDPDTRLAARLR